MLTVYGDRRSGNCLKVLYACDYLGVAYRFVSVDITQGESRTEAFLRRNPAGQIPLVEFDNGFVLAQSNAILLHLADGTPLFGGNKESRSKIHEWLFWEQYNHEPNIAVCRYQMVYLGEPKERLDPAKVSKGNEALALMNRHLTNTKWLVNDEFSVADIALFPYTQACEEGGFSLSSYAGIRDWLKRTAAQLEVN